MYEEHMLQVADALFEMEVVARLTDHHAPARGPPWSAESTAVRGGSLAGLRPPPSSVQPTENNPDHRCRSLHGLLFPRRSGHRPGFIYPEGNLDIHRFLFSILLVVLWCACVCLDVQIRAMQGCALCLFEQEKRQRSFNQKGLRKILQVLNFLRTMMQVLQPHEHLCWHVYNGTHHLCVVLSAIVKCTFYFLGNQYLTLAFSLLSVKFLYTSTRSAITWWPPAAVRRYSLTT